MFLCIYDVLEFIKYARAILDFIMLTKYIFNNDKMFYYR